MIGKAMQQYALGEGFSVNDKCAFGVMEGYLVTLYDSIGKKTCFVNYYLDDEQDSAKKKYALSEVIKANLEDYQIEDYEIEDNGITVIIKDSLIKLSEFLPLLLNALKESGMTGVNTCSECGAEIKGEAKKAAVNLKRYGLCDSCALELIQKMNGRHDDPDDDKAPETKKRSLGWLGALITFIVGTALWIILYSLEVFGEGNNIIPAFLLSFVFPILTIKLYDVFGGKKGVARTLTVCISTLLMIFVGMYFGTFINYISSVGASFSVIADATNWTIPFESTETFFANPFIKESLVSLLSSAISILIFITSLFKSKDSASKIEIS